MILKNEIPHSQLEDQPKKTFISLTHISSMSHFHTPWKRQKTYGFMNLLVNGTLLWLKSVHQKRIKPLQEYRF